MPEGTGSNALYFTALAAALALSFLFSGMESGMFALSRLRIRQQMRAGKRRAKILFRFLENTEQFLWTILIGNVLSNLLAISLIFWGLAGLLLDRPWLFGGALAVLVFLFYALCDLLPKMLFRLYPNRLCLVIAAPFRIVHLLLSPIVFVVESSSNLLLRLTGGRIFTGHLFGSRAELRMVMQESAQGFTTEEKTMINRVLDAQDIQVRSVTVPLNRMTAVSGHTRVAELVEVFRKETFSRMPVWEGRGAERRIVGIVTLDTLIFSGGSNLNRVARDLMRPALYVSEELRLDEALRRMQRGGHRVAVVLGLDGKETGVVTLQDILKTVFGEVTL